MTEMLVKFEPVDTWFFRESRPHGSVGANALNSVFPPPVRTLIGAVRSWVGHEYMAKHQESWDNLANLSDLKAVIGDGDSLGSLRPKGAFIACHENNQDIYYLPTPFNICTKSSDDTSQYLAFELTKDSFETDIGTIRLVELPKQTNIDTVGFKPMENVWLSKTAWEQLLSGQIDTLNHTNAVRHQTDFLGQEYRLGIEIDNHRQVQDGKLYQTTHLRLKPEISVIMPISYDDNQLKKIEQSLDGDTLVRLGGEARMANVSFEPSSDYLPEAPKGKIAKMVGDKKQFMLYLLTKLPVENEWLPKGFVSNEQGFCGVVHGIEMTIVSACIGKAHREGGWNQLTHAPRAIESYLPAGSAFFVEVAGDVSDDALRALHGKSLDENDTWGHGIMLIGQVL